MKVTFKKALTVNITNPNFDKTHFVVGEEIDVPESIAQSLNASGYIEWVVEEPEVVKPKKTSKRKTKVVKDIETQAFTNVESK